MNKIRNKTIRKIELISLFVMLSAGLVYYGLNSSFQNSDNKIKSVSSKTALPLKVETKTPPKAIRVSRVIINYDQYGFQPNQFRVPVGTMVGVKNNGNTVLDFQALPNQPNQLQGLNLGYINPGQTKYFKLTKIGSWQFQANSNPAIRGDVSATAVGQSSVSLTENELPVYNPTNKTLLLNYTNYGFLPNIAKVPVGTKVIVRNSTNQGGMFFMESPNDSIQNPSLNLGYIAKGSSSSFVLNQPGTWHYVNGWETTDRGQITAY